MDERSSELNMSGKAWEEWFERMDSTASSIAVNATANLVIAEREIYTTALRTRHEREVEKLKIALADAIRCPMGVMPWTADGLLTVGDLQAAENRRIENRRIQGRHQPLTTPTNAETEGGK